MQKSVKNFSIDDVQMYREQQEDADFSVVEIWALAEGNNSHRNPFSREVLEKYSDTFKGKFIVAKFDKWTKDAEGHELDEVITGYIDPREEIEFKTKEVDGIEKEFVVIRGLLSKIYATEIVEMFRTHNDRTVSCEFSCSTMYEENEYGKPIDSNGVVLDIDNPILSYHIHGITILGMKYNPSVKGTEIKVKQFASTNKTLKELAKERLGIINKKEFSNENLLNKTQDKEDIMEEVLEKQFESESKEEEKDVIMEEVENVEETEKVEEEEKTETFEDETKEMTETEDKEEPQEQEEKEMGCGEKEMSETETDEDKNEEVKEEEKKFSIADFLTITFEENDELVNKIKAMSADEIVNTIIEFSKENIELKQFKEDRLNKDKEVKLSAIMASVKEDLDTKKFSELQEEGKTLSYNELDGFENKVKAFAYEANKERKTAKHDDVEFMMFAGVTENNNAEKNDSADDIFKKYL